MRGYSVPFDLACINIDINLLWSKVHLALRVAIDPHIATEPNMDVLGLRVDISVAAVVPLQTVVVLKLRNLTRAWVEAKSYRAVLVHHGVQLNQVSILFLLHLLIIHASLRFLQVNRVMFQTQVWLQHLVLGLRELLPGVLRDS